MITGERFIMVYVRLLFVYVQEEEQSVWFAMITGRALIFEEEIS